MVHEDGAGVEDDLAGGAAVGGEAGGVEGAAVDGECVDVTGDRADLRGIAVDRAAVDGAAGVVCVVWRGRHDLSGDGAAVYDEVSAIDGVRKHVDGATEGASR